MKTLNDERYAAVCIGNFCFENTELAFKDGQFYEWRHATQQEFNETGCEYVFVSELGPDHYMSHDDVAVHFMPDPE